MAHDDELIKFYTKIFVALRNFPIQFIVKEEIDQKLQFVLVSQEMQIKGSKWMS